MLIGTQKYKPKKRNTAYSPESVGLERWKGELERKFMI